MRLYLLTNGRIVVGQAVRSFPGVRKFTQALFIEKWGTTKGVTELVPGPLPGTEAYLAEALLVRDHSIVLSLPAGEGWNNSSLGWLPGVNTPVVQG
jgi:hypothetical protein